METLFFKGIQNLRGFKNWDKNNTLNFFQICRKSLGSNNFQTFSWFWKRNRYKEWKNLSTCVLFKNHWWSYNATTGSFSSDVRVAMAERSMFIIQNAEIVLLQNHLWEFLRLSETLKTSYSWSIERAVGLRRPFTALISVPTLSH